MELVHRSRAAHREVGLHHMRSSTDVQPNIWQVDGQSSFTMGMAPRFYLLERRSRRHDPTDISPTCPGLLRNSIAEK